MLSDFTKSPKYQNARDQFLQRQAQIMPQVGEEQNSLIEFEVNFNLLTRYFNLTQDSSIEREYRPELKKACKYLLKKSKEALHQYTLQTDNFEIRDAFEVYAKKKFKKQKQYHKK